MRILTRVLLVAALIGLGILGWRMFFTSPQKVIRARLNELAKSASFQPNEGPLAVPINAAKAAGFFTPDVEIVVDVRRRSREKFVGRDQILQGLVTARTMVRSLDLEFLDINVTVAPDKNSAEANLTAKAKTPGDDFGVQELKLNLVKSGRDWLISRVETIKTLE
jgi:hypothetical protein